ncbi:MAG: response regulator [Deltaproteobacteria bacterium]|jgi:diguanylate cyclase (GGDEF)-like protein/PAS domain S-box-containing protein|nr:response regulator [Deltaproteobacteria bacterium]MDA8158828.1 response regulator [Deltaproteobacteria bacterium]
MNGIMAKILIYGGGNAAKTLIGMFQGDKNVGIAALVARNLDKEGAVLAKELNIKSFKTIKEVKAHDIDFNIIFNLTGQPEVELPELAELHESGIEIINSVSSKLVYDLLYDRHKNHIDKESIIKQLREQKAYFKNILDDSFDMIMVTDRRGLITEFNKGGENMLGYSQKEVIGRRASEFYINPEERDDILEKLKKDKFVANYETLLRKKDDSMLDISLTISRIMDKNGDIIGTIGISKDITDKKLQEKRLKELNESLENKVIERTKQLEESIKELSRANELKSKFIANMSHELRTPLNAIIGYSDLLKDSPDLSEKHKKYTGNILVSGKHLLQLINNILDISKIEAGMFSLEYSVFSIKEAIEEAIVVLKSLAVKKNLAISVEYECSGDYKLYSDRVKFKQIIYNLLSNAIKFSFENTEIKVVCKNIPPSLDIKTKSNFNLKKYSKPQDKMFEYIQIDVINSGIGIDDNFKNKIFEEFTQADNNYSRQYEGTGLGLALTKKIVELHGGHINFESVKNDFTDFTFVLPNPLEAEVSAMSSEDAEKTLITVDAKTFFRDNNVKRNKPLVLVAEDDRPTSEIFTINLVNSGYSVAHAYDGIETLEKAKSLKPFAILLDIMLPRKDGWDVLNELKTDKDTKNIPVIITSIIDNKDLGFALGATDYLIKPIDKETLIHTLSQFTLTSKRKRRQVNILLVDDDPVIHKMIEKLLVGEGFNLVHAYNGEEGLRMAIELKPDLILLDLIMPDIDGFEVAENIKKHPISAQIPIFIITSKDLTVEERLKLSGNIERIIGKKSFSAEELSRSIRELELIYPQKAGLFDEITGLLDHNYFNIRLAQEINRAKRYNIVFSVVFLDIDNFKEYCDLVGNFHSDIALKKISEMLKKLLRGSDVVVRFGYDEFAIILNNTLKDAAAFVANRFCSVVRDYPFYKEEELKSKKLTASFIVASFPKDGGTPEELISKIYNRLCDVKSSGGNAVAEVSR